MVKFCIKCGSSIPDDVNFCPACGANNKLDNIDTTQSSQEPVQNQPSEPQKVPDQEQQSISQEPIRPQQSYSPPQQNQQQAYGKTQAYGQPQQKKSKNKMIFLIIGIIAIVIVVVLLLWFLVFSGGDGTLIGKWNVEEDTSYGPYITSQIWTFSEDNNLTIEIDGIFPAKSGTWTYNWKTENGRITSSDYDSPFGSGSGCRYEIINGGNTVKIYDSFDESWCKYTLTRK